MPPKKATVPSRSPAKPVTKIPATTAVKTGQSGGAKSTQTAPEADKSKEESQGVKVNLKQLDSVLLRDEGGKIKSSGKWPLLIDESETATSFLRHRDTNYLNALDPSHMQSERIRIAVLGGIRFGKPVVLDLMDVADMFDTVRKNFDTVLVGLMDMIMNKEILKEDNYEKLIKETDGDDYNRNYFDDSRISDFMFVVATSISQPAKYLLDNTYVLRIQNLP